jgi:hypothetical protein
MSQHSQDPVVLHIQSLVDSGLITSSRDLTEYLDTIGANYDMRMQVVSAGLYVMFGERFRHALDAVLSSLKSDLHEGRIPSLQDLDSRLHREACSLEPYDPSSAYTILRISCRQEGIYDFLEDAELRPVTVLA